MCRLCLLRLICYVGGVHLLYTASCPLEGLLCYTAWCTYYAPPVFHRTLYANIRWRPLQMCHNILRCSSREYPTCASFPACSCTLWFREHGGGALHPSGNCAGSRLRSKCRKHVAWPLAAGLAGEGLRAFRWSWRYCRGRWWPRHGFLAFRSWHSDCQSGSASALVTSGWR